MLLKVLGHIESLRKGVRLFNIFYKIDTVFSYKNTVSIFILYYMKRFF